MTLKEAVLKSLDDIDKITNYLEVYNRIIEKLYYDFGTSQRPTATVSATLGTFIRKGDTRVKRINQEGGAYSYYLAKNEPHLEIEDFATATVKGKRTEKQDTYDERDLHKLLSSYLKSTGVYSKTIFHEQSTFLKDNNQKWTHPDLIGIRFLNLKMKASQNLLKTVNRVESFKMCSYEVKKEINSDHELKKAFFQAVSNSSWANYGYLVAFEFSDSLTDEIERLNQSFGIGVIELHANPYQSKVLFQPKYHELDFKTIDKLCKINKEFERFIEQTEKLMTADERYYKAIENEFEGCCDNSFDNDTAIMAYCIEKTIPFEPEEFDCETDSPSL